MAALVDVLAEASASCPELEAWRSCGSGPELVGLAGEKRCKTCILGGQQRCESQVIKALAGRLAEATTKKL